MPPFERKTSTGTRTRAPAKKAGEVKEAGTERKRESLSESSDYGAVMYYGEPGSGKTTDLAHMAKLGKVLFINAESGAKRRALQKFDIPLENIEIFPSKDERVSYTALDDLFWEIKAKLAEDPNYYVGVTWDSITEIHKILLEHVTKRGVEKLIRKMERQGQDTSEVDPFFIDLSYYGTMTEQMRQLIRRYRDLPCHVAISALPRRDQNEKTGDLFYGPSLTPALQTDIMGYMDQVCRTYYDDDNDVFLGSFIQQGIRVAKDRDGLLPRILVDPTFDRIMGYLKGELDAKTDPLQEKVPVRKRTKKSDEEDE